MPIMSQQELINFAAEQGRVAADGDDSIFVLASQCMYRGSDPSCSTDTAEFVPVYVAYATTKNASGYGRKVDLTKEASIKASASKLARFSKVGRLGYFDLVEKIMRCAPEGSRYEQISRVFVAQLKRPERMLTRDEILAALAPVGPKAKTIDAFVNAELAKFDKFEKNELEGIDAQRFSTLRAALVATATEFLKDPAAFCEPAEQEEISTENIVEDIAEKLAAIGRVTTAGRPNLEDVLHH